MATVQQLINSALRLIGVIDSGETPATAESDDAFAALNQLLTNWSAAAVPVYQVARDVIPLTGAASYTIASRPVKLKSAHVTSAGVSMPVNIVTSEVWSRFKDRTRTGLFADELYWDGAYPTGTLALWPNPNAGSLEVYSIKPLTAFGSLSETINLPPGYEHALRFALAQALAPEYGAVLSPELQAGAAEAKTAIATLNTQVLGPPLPASGPAPVAASPAT
jgi:hypothetical protein